MTLAHGLGSVSIRAARPTLVAAAAVLAIAAPSAAQGVATIVDGPGAGQLLDLSSSSGGVIGPGPGITSGIIQGHGGGCPDAPFDFGGQVFLTDDHYHGILHSAQDPNPTGCGHGRVLPGDLTAFFVTPPPPPPPGGGGGAGLGSVTVGELLAAVNDALGLGRPADDRALQLEEIVDTGARRDRPDRGLSPSLQAVVTAQDVISLSPPPRSRVASLGGIDGMLHSFGASAPTDLRSLRDPGMVELMPDVVLTARSPSARSVASLLTGASVPGVAFDPSLLPVSVQTLGPAFVVRGSAGTGWSSYAPIGGAGASTVVIDVGGTAGSPSRLATIFPSADIAPLGKGFVGTFRPELLGKWQSLGLDRLSLGTSGGLMGVDAPASSTSGSDPAYSSYYSSGAAGGGGGGGSLLLRSTGTFQELGGGAGGGHGAGGWSSYPPGHYGGGGGGNATAGPPRWESYAGAGGGGGGGSGMQVRRGSGFELGGAGGGNASAGSTWFPPGYSYASGGGGGGGGGALVVTTGNRSNTVGAGAAAARGPGPSELERAAAFLVLGPSLASDPRAAPTPATTPATSLGGALQQSQATASLSLVPPITAGVVTYATTPPPTLDPRVKDRIDAIFATFKGTGDLDGVACALYDFNQWHKASFGRPYYEWTVNERDPLRLLAFTSNFDAFKYGSRMACYEFVHFCAYIASDQPTRPFMVASDPTNPDSESVAHPHQRSVPWSFSDATIGGANESLADHTATLTGRVGSGLVVTGVFRLPFNNQAGYYHTGISTTGDQIISLGSDGLVKEAITGVLGGCFPSVGYSQVNIGGYQWAGSNPAPTGSSR